MSDSPASREPVCFCTVFRNELRDISAARKGAAPPPLRPARCSRRHQHGDRAFPGAHHLSLFGLALSGGGIRSATFNLGVIESLADLGLLHRLDYLSTVSGGGYAGGWLSAALKRERERSARLDPARHGLPRRSDTARPVDVTGDRAALDHLRRYSNYLTPRKGLLSADAWAFAVTYVRNLVLNLLVLTAALTAILMVVWWLPALSFAVVVLSAVACDAIGRNLRFLRQPDGGDDEDGRAATTTGAEARGAERRSLRGRALAFARGLSGRPDRWYSQRPVVWATIGLPLLGATFLLPPATAGFVAFAERSGLAGAGAGWTLVAGALHLLLWIASLQKRSWVSLGVHGQHATLRRAWVALAAFLSGCVGGVLLWSMRGVVASEGLRRYWLGPPLATLVLVATTFLYLGLLGRLARSQDREWWSHISGWLLIVAAAWTALAGITLYAPDLLRKLREWPLSSTGVGGGWLLTTLAGVLAGRSERTADEHSSRALEAVARIAPPVFIAGFLALISLAIAAWIGPADQARPAQIGWAAVLAVLAVALSWRFDINEFSMHNLYRNRLVRSYLGASNRARKPHAVTGFARDDLELASLVGARPFPIVNTTLNVVAGDELAWQERQARPFVLTPRFCGYGEVAGRERAAEADRGSYLDSRVYGGGVSLGTAMAISGAAASPSMGHHSSRPLSFLMTIFNVRLGWWLGNPGTHSGFDSRLRKSFGLPPAVEARGPEVGLWWLLREMLGLTTDRSRFVYLSDGGHFENLGVYELVRRRCRLIIASDATADPDLEFTDLGNALRKCRTDLGIDIDIDVGQLARGGDGRSRWHAAVGTIRYPEGSDGTLVYLKPSLTGDEPNDVLNYARSHAAFPHQSTADQWFDESQFESYRILGKHVATSTLRPGLGHGRGDEPVAVEPLRLRLAQTWYPPSDAVKSSFTKHTEALDQLFERLRGDRELDFLDPQFYPEWSRFLDGSDDDVPPQPASLLPRSASERRKAFYLCNSMIQLMEDVYLDLDLDHDHRHPDNRGWMNLFKHWSWSPMFRVAWSISISTYGARFQRFCEDQLGLGFGDIETVAGEPAELNPVERRLHDAILGHALNRPFGERTGVRVRLLQLKVDDGSGAATGEYRYPFGFALERGGALIYLRIQDHLRRMGLARRAIEQLVAADRVRRITLPPWLPVDAIFWSKPDEEGREPQPEALEEADKLAFARLFRSAYAEGKRLRQRRRERSE